MKRLLLGLAVALSLSACSAGASTKAAEAGVTSFHTDMDAGKYGAIYDASSSDMKTAITRDDFIKLLDGLHTKLGAFKSGKTTGWNVNVGTEGNMVTLNREAVFERGPGTEE